MEAGWWQTWLVRQHCGEPWIEALGMVDSLGLRGFTQSHGSAELFACEGLCFGSVACKCSRASGCEQRASNLES